jgi:hypothetical protein
MRISILYDNVDQFIGHNDEFHDLLAHNERLDSIIPNSGSPGHLAHAYNAALIVRTPVASGPFPFAHFAVHLQDNLGALFASEF